MAKNTSVTLGDHFEDFIGRQIERGRYGSASEVVRASLRLLEEHEHRVEALRLALVDGEQSGDAGELDMESVKQKARSRAAQSVLSVLSVSVHLPNGTFSTSGSTPLSDGEKRKRMRT